MKCILTYRLMLMKTTHDERDVLSRARRQQRDRRSHERSLPVFLQMSSWQRTAAQQTVDVCEQVQDKGTPENQSLVVWPGSHSSQLTAERHRQQTATSASNRKRQAIPIHHTPLDGCGYPRCMMTNQIYMQSTATELRHCGSGRNPAELHVTVKPDTHYTHIQA